VFGKSVTLMLAALPRDLQRLIQNYQINFEVGALLNRFEKAVTFGKGIDDRGPPPVMFAIKKLKKVVKRYIQKHELRYITFAEGHWQRVVDQRLIVLKIALISFGLEMCGHLMVAVNLSQRMVIDDLFYHQRYLEWLMWDIACDMETESCQSPMDCLVHMSVLEYVDTCSDVLNDEPERDIYAKTFTKLRLGLASEKASRRCYLVRDLIKNKQDLITNYFKPLA